MLLHVTLNTGDVYHRPPSALSSEILATLRQLLESGGPIPPAHAFRVTVGRSPGAASFAVLRGQEPITLSVVCWDPAAAAATWDSIERQYLHIAERAGGALPEMPGETPWLATLILPPIQNQPRHEIEWLADFEGCMAEAAVHFYRPTPPTS